MLQCVARKTGRFCTPLDGFQLFHRFGFPEPAPCAVRGVQSMRTGRQNAATGTPGGVPGGPHARCCSPWSSRTRVELVLKLEPLLRVKAKENQRLSDGKGKQKSADLKAEPIETRQELAKAAGVSHDTIAKGKVIEAKASNSPMPLQRALVPRARDVHRLRRCAQSLSRATHVIIKR